MLQNPHRLGLLARSRIHRCTISGHGLVDRLHLIENMCTYKDVFFVD